LGKQGGDRRSEKARADQGSDTTLKQVGRGRAYVLARLDRDGHAALAAKVRAGELSANAAAIEAGFCKAPKYPTALFFQPHHARARHHHRLAEHCNDAGIWRRDGPDKSAADVCAANRSAAATPFFPPRPAAVALRRRIGLEDGRRGAGRERAGVARAFFVRNTD
jgi:hypothetical protein